MRAVKRVLALGGVLIGGLVYVWFAAVRAVPAVKRRKARIRAGLEPLRKPRRP